MLEKASLRGSFPHFFVSSGNLEADHLHKSPLEDKNEISWENRILRPDLGLNGSDRNMQTD